MELSLEDKCVALIAKGDIKSIGEMIKNGFDIRFEKDEGIIFAAMKGEVEVIKFLLKHNLDVNAKNGEALILSAMYGEIKSVRYLIEHGADININENAALKNAVEQNKLNVVQYFVIECNQNIDEVMSYNQKNNNEVYKWAKQYKETIDLKNDLEEKLEKNPHNIKKKKI